MKHRIWTALFLCAALLTACSAPESDRPAAPAAPVSVSPADVEAYIAAAQACRILCYRDEAVMDILLTECAPMLRGEAAPEETASRIQSRVSLYMAEKYG